MTTLLPPVHSYIIGALPVTEKLGDYLESALEVFRGENEKARMSSTYPQHRSFNRLFLQEVWATSREAAQQVAIELSRECFDSRWVDPQSRHTRFFRVLAIRGRLIPTVEAEILCGGRPHAWKRIKRDFPCRTWWVGASLSGSLGFRMMAVRSSSESRALEQAAFTKAREAGEGVQEGVNAPPLSILCVPATLAARAPVEGFPPELWFPHFDRIASPACAHIVDPAPYRRRIARSLSIPSFTGILPTDFPDKIERMHYRHAALRQAVVDMAYTLGKNVIHSYPLRNGKSTGDFDELPDRGTLRKDTGGGFLDKKQPWWRGNQEALASWDVTINEIERTYDSLHPVDLLRYCCPDLSTETVGEWAHSFPWKPTMVPYKKAGGDVAVRLGLPRLKEGAQDLRPWYTLHTQLWHRYVQDCREWARGKAYAKDAVLTTAHMKEHPWLRQEFFVNVKKALMQFPPSRFIPHEPSAIATFDESISPTILGAGGESTPPRSELWVSPKKWTDFARSIRAPRALWYPPPTVTAMER